MGSMKGVRMSYDPIREVMEVCTKLYPDLDIDIYLYDGPTKGRNKSFGHAAFPDDGGPAGIGLNMHTPYHAVAEIIAHEVAHVVNGPDLSKDPEQEHGAAWKSIFATIHEAVCKLHPELSI